MKIVRIKNRLLRAAVTGITCLGLVGIIYITGRLAGFFGCHFYPLGESAGGWPLLEGFFTLFCGLGMALAAGALGWFIWAGIRGLHNAFDS